MSQKQKNTGTDMADLGTEMQPSEPRTQADVEAAEAAGETAMVEPEASELKRLQAERDALNEQLLRAAADFDNYRKRTQREFGEIRQHAVVETVRAFLPVMDNFERALAFSGGSLDDFRKGMEMIQRQLQEAAKRAGLEPIEAVGKPFDPHWHEAIEMVETKEHPDHAVIDELQKGYRLKDKLVRPAMVKVARNQ